jgi:rfaE bifunctional protein kinase chain/domain
LRLDELLQRLAGRSVWVVGDLMLDEYLIGSVERISPEGPVPVLRVEDREVRPGGAANVARQIAALGARVHLAGIVGSDEPGEALLALCSEHGVDTQAVARLHGRRTTRKTRALSKGHQLLRVDSEESTRIEPAHTHELLERLQRAPRPDVVVVSDYAKGVVSDGLTTSLREISEARWILVDPKRDDLRTYRGADVLTPNLA